MFSMFVYLEDLRKTGLENATLDLNSTFAELLSDTSFLMTLVVMSAGWGVTRAEMLKKEHQVFTCSAVTYFLLDTLRLSCDEDVDVSCRAYLLSFFAMRFLLTFFIIVALNANIEGLRSRALYEPTPGVAYKYQIFTDLRMYFVGFLLIPIVILFISLGDTSWEHAYIPFATQELLLCFIYVFVGLSFRPVKSGLDYPSELQAFPLLMEDDDDSDDELF